MHGASWERVAELARRRAPRRVIVPAIWTGLLSRGCLVRFPDGPWRSLRAISRRALHVLPVRWGGSHLLRSMALSCAAGARAGLRARPPASGLGSLGVE